MDLWIYGWFCFCAIVLHLQAEDGYLISSAHKSYHYDAWEIIVEDYHSSLRKINTDGELLFFEEIADYTIRNMDLLDDGNFL